MATGARRGAAFRLATLRLAAGRRALALELAAVARLRVGRGLAATARLTAVFLALAEVRFAFISALLTLSGSSKFLLQIRLWPGVACGKLKVENPACVGA